jgi:hypothetical protein
MHDVSYSAKDKVKELRERLRKFMTRLQRGKHGDDNLRLTGTARLAHRQEHKKLRAE